MPETLRLLKYTLKLPVIKFMYSAESVANAFLDLARREEKKLTNMQLQKLVYLAHGFYLAKLGEPLIHNNIHAFEWGPVIPGLYQSLRQYGAGDVKNDVPTYDATLAADGSEIEIIREVWNEYKEFSGLELSDFTPRAGSPWSETWKINQFGVIPDEQIAEYYRRDLYERYTNQP